MAIKFGLVGYGTIAPFYLKAIEKNPNTLLLAVCDTDESKKAEIEKKGFHYLRDYKELISNEDIDAIIIAAPNYLHSKITIAALKAGKHVICEKPMATNAKDASEMVKTAKKEKKALFVAFHCRFNEQVLKMKSKNKDIVGFRAVNFENILDHCNSNNPWYLNKKLSGGGCIIDNGINFIDVLYEFIQPLTFVKSEILDEREGIEVKAKLFFKQGELELDWNSSKEVKKIVLISENNDEYQINFLDKENDESIGSHMFHEYENLLEYFLTCLKNTNCYGERGLYIQQIIDKIYSL